MVMFWGFSNSTGESILNSLEAVYLGDVHVEAFEAPTNIAHEAFGLLVF